MAQFSIGDVVAIKSGGPPMTVQNVGRNMVERPTVWTQWFEGSEVKQGNFPPEALEKLEGF